MNKVYMVAKTVKGFDANLKDKEVQYVPTLTKETVVGVYSSKRKAVAINGIYPNTTMMEFEVE